MNRLDRRSGRTAVPSKPAPIGLVLNGRFLGRPMTGVDRSAYELAHALASLQSELGFDLTIAVPPAAAELARREFGDEADVFVVGGRLRGHLWEQVSLARVRRDAWLLSLCNTGPAFRRKQAVLVHDAQFRTQPDSYSRWFRLIYSGLIPVLCRRASAVFTVSNYSRGVLEQEGLAPKGQLGLLPNGTDHLDRVEADSSTLEQLGLEPDGYFLAVGSPAPHKNLRTLYDAVGRDDGPQAPLVVVGSVDSRVHGRGHAVQGSGGVRPVGRVTDGQLKALYGGALALCIPSLTEGFGLAAVEAMRCGAPVVAADAGALPEVCGSAAVLLPPTDSAVWAQSLRRLEMDTDKRIQLRSMGAERARELEWSPTAVRLVAALGERQGRVPTPTATSRGVRSPAPEEGISA